MAKRMSGKLFLLLTIFFIFSIFSSGCLNSSGSKWRSGVPLSKDAVKIGVIHIGDTTDGYSLAHELGVQSMQAELELRDEQIIRKMSVNDSNALEAEHAIRECIAEGANVIIATSWGYMDVCESLAAEFPNIVFAHASGYKYNDTNFTNYFGRIYQARYLSGIAAGLLTETNKLGYVAAMGVSNSEVTGGLNAFALGVESVNPEAEILVRVTNSWYDPAGERLAAQQLIEEGCDVLSQHCDTSAPLVEAEKAGVLAIGYNNNALQDAPNAVLTSVVWNWGVYYTYLIKGVIDGSFTTTPYFGGLSEGMVGISPLNIKLSTAEIEAAIAAASERILSGEANVFDGVMATNDGRQVGKQGGTLSDKEIAEDIDWYYRNVIVLD